MEDLFERVREEATRATWSAGVQLARAGAVSGESRDAAEQVLRVSQRQGLWVQRVTLYLNDADWSCDCPDAEDPCSHVAAAVIALRRAEEEGRDLFEGEAAQEGRISYRFTRSQGRLALERVVKSAGRSHVLTSTLAGVASGRVEGPAFNATEEDHAAERALGSRLRGVLPPGVLKALLQALERAPDVRLDGEPVRASGTPLRIEGRVEDAGEGFRLFVEPVPAVDESFHNGAILSGDTLHPVGETRLTGRELEELPVGRIYGPDRALELVSEALPDLRARIPVDVRTSRLPQTTDRVPPRLRVEVGREAESLVVFPTLVYGDPPSARVDAGRLVALGGPIPLRDLEAERALVRTLQNELELAPGRRVTVSGEEAVTLAQRLARTDVDVVGDAHRSFRRVAPLAPALSIEGRRLALDFISAGDAEETAAPRRADPARVLRAWRSGESLVPLEGGGFAALPGPWLERVGERVSDLLAARGADDELPMSAVPDLARLAQELGEPPPADFARLRALAEGFDALPEAELPGDLAAELRGYQRDGVRWLQFLRQAGLGGLLADDMGLGKTLQALCALHGRTLVVAPTSVLHNWVAETARFRPGLRAAVYHGPRRELPDDADVVLTTYAILRLDAERLAAERWDTAILDEGQYVKNPDSQVAKAAHALRAEFRLVLTGTPVENRLDELWSQLQFADPGLLGSRRDFDARYARPISDGDESVAERLRERIRPFVLRRRKSEVARELPPRTEVVLHCTLSEPERAVYDAVRAATVPAVVERLRAGGNVMQALEALLRLRQAACHPRLVPGQSIEGAEGSSKLELLLEELEQSVAEGHKSLVFSQWTSFLDLTEPHLRAAGIDFTRLDGSTRDRAGVVERFQADDGPPVLLVSLRAGGIGLNLTAADCVLLRDPWWNPAVEEQAADRAHRIGQDKPVVVYRLVAEDTVEERILALQESKRALAEVALGEAGRAASLSRDDLLALLDG
jgi:superfamily II DNA or RNA helicase